jgi:hypothetical protein
MSAFRGKADISATAALQIHHIDNNPSNNSPDNLTVLYTRATMTRRINEADLPGGRRPADLRLHRTHKIEAVAKSRLDAIEFSAKNQAGINRQPEAASTAGEFDPTPLVQLFGYLESPPGTLKAAYRAARALWDTGVTSEMINGSYIVVDSLEQMWLRLARWLSPAHFEGMSPEQYVSEQLALQRNVNDFSLSPHGRARAAQALL